MSRIDTSQSIELIYSAITRPELWSDVVQSMVRDVGSNSGILCVEKLDHSAVLAYNDYGLDPDAMQSYAEYYVSTDLWVDGMYARPVNQFHLSHEVTSQRVFLESEMYNDWGRYQNMLYATGIYVDSPKDVALRLCLQRSDREGRYTAEEQQVLNSIAPHLRRAITVHNDLVDLRLVDESASRILDQMPFAALLVDDRCRIHYRNAGAEALIAKGDAVRDPGGVLSVDTSASGFERLVYQSVVAGQGRGSVAGGILRVRDRKSHALYEVSVSPLVVDDFRLCLQYQKVLALVVVRDLDLQVRLPATVLRLYEFTKTECDVVQLLCIGLSASQIARSLNRSFHTVRTHIRNILSKTETSSQAELIAKMLGGIAPLSPGAAHGTTPFTSR